jgi:hypothetical protein
LRVLGLTLIQNRGPNPKKCHNIHQAPRDSRINLPLDGSLPLEKDYHQPQLRRSKHANVPCHRFEIEGEAFMVSSQDNYELKIVQEVLSSSTKSKWIKAMNVEMELLRANQVWDLVNIAPG